MLIDVSNPGDRNVIKKEAKILKYKDLIIEIQRMWNVKEKVIPVINGVEPAASKFPRRERALGGNPQARTPTNNATSRLGGRASKRRSPWGILVQESFHPQLISTDMSDKQKLLFQTINNKQKMKQVMITTM
jgi:hypothetical protein